MHAHAQTQGSASQTVEMQAGEQIGIVRVNPNYNRGYAIPTFSPIYSVECEFPIDGAPQDAIRTPDLVGKCEESRVAVKQLSGKHKEIFHVSFPNASALTYTPGDSVSFKVSNADARAVLMLKILSLEGRADNPFAFRRIHKKTGEIAFSYKGTLLAYFKHMFDFASIPSKAFLHKLHETVPHPACKDGVDARDYLRYLSSKDGSRDYFSLYGSWSSLLDIVVTFNCMPSLEMVLAYGAEIKPRSFSLINHKDQSDLAFICGAMTKSMHGANRPFLRHGHTSAFIRQLHSGGPGSCGEGCIYDIEVKPNRLMRISYEAKHLVLFCTGTGVAPFISFIRNRLSSQTIDIFYGCRDQDDNILHCMGLASSSSGCTDLVGSTLYNVSAQRVSKRTDRIEEGVTANVVYSRENRKIHLDEFLDLNEALLREYFTRLRDRSEIYICTRRELQGVLEHKLRKIAGSEFVAERLRIDDWM